MPLIVNVTFKLFVVNSQIYLILHSLLLIFVTFYNFIMVKMAIKKIQTSSIVSRLWPVRKINLHTNIKTTLRINGTGISESVAGGIPRGRVGLTRPRGPIDAVSRQLSSSARMYLQFCTFPGGNAISRVTAVVSSARLCFHASSMGHSFCASLRQLRRCRWDGDGVVVSVAR